MCVFLLRCGIFRYPLLFSQLIVSYITKFRFKVQQRKAAIGRQCAFNVTIFDRHFCLPLQRNLFHRIEVCEVSTIILQQQGQYIHDIQDSRRTRFVFFQRSCCHFRRTFTSCKIHRAVCKMTLYPKVFVTLVLSFRSPIGSGSLRQL